MNDVEAHDAPAQLVGDERLEHGVGERVVHNHGGPGQGDEQHRAPERARRGEQRNHEPERHATHELQPAVRTPA